MVMPGPKRRTEVTHVKCEFCNAEDLSWKPLYRSGEWQQLNPDGSLHSCLDRALTRYNLEGLKDRLANDILRETEGLSEIYAKNARREFEAVAVDATLKVHHDIESKLQALSPQLDIMAREAIAQAMPVEHRIVVSNNGHDKVLPGKPHHQVPLLIEILSQRLHVMLVGPAGSGKSTAASQAAEALSLEYYEQSMGPATSQWDLKGYLTPDGRYVPGILRSPYEHGGLLMLDELDNSNPSVLTVLNSALSNGHCAFPDRMVFKHPDFVLVGAGNTYGRGADRVYVGRQQLDGATLDRFAVLDWDYDEDAELDWAGRDQIKWTRYVQNVRHSAVYHAMRIIVSPRASIFGANLLRAGIEPMQVANLILWKGISQDDRNRLTQNVGVYEHDNVA